MNPNLVDPEAAQQSQEKLVFHHTSTIRYEEKTDGHQRHLFFHVKDVKPPTVTLSVAPDRIEVGQVVTAIFAATIQPGSEAIKTREITPLDYVQAPSPLPNNFTFRVEDVSRSTGGKVAYHHLAVTDEMGQVGQDDAEISVDHRHFILFSTARQITALELQAALDAGQGTLAPTIRAAFAGLRAYAVPEAVAGKKHFIHWLMPASDFAGIGQPKDESGFPVPLEKSPDTIQVTNSYGVSLAYRDVATANSYGAFTFQIRID